MEISTAMLRSVQAIFSLFHSVCSRYAVSSCGGLSSQGFLIRPQVFIRDCHARSTILEQVMRWIPSQAMPLMQALWRHRWLAMGTAWLVCTVGWIGAALMPTKFESSARVYLNTDPLLTPLLHGLAADTNPSRHLDFMLRTLLSRPNLEQLIRLTDLDIGIRIPGEKEALLKSLATDLEVRPITQNLLILSYRDGDPVLAKNIVQSLLTIFAEKMWPAATELTWTAHNVS